jgi:hypothetical protein
MRKITICRLCRREATLQSSHLIPRAVYREIRASRNPNPYPVLVTSDVVKTVSRQVVRHLLCSDCEQMLSKNGERDVMQIMRRRSGSFLLQSFLNSIEPRVQSPTVKIYRGHPQIDELVYFASSVFWRAGAARWQISMRSSLSLELGPYEELLRSFLLSAGDFPSGLSMGIQMVTDPILQQMVRFPASRREQSIRVFNFQIPGIQFSLWAGKHQPESLMNFCAARTGSIFVHPDLERENLRGFVKAFGDLTLAGRIYRNDHSVRGGYASGQ